MPGKACKSDKTCLGDNQVCGGAGFCVDCQGDGDCLSGAKCIAHKCVKATPCQSSKQCAGKVCDKKAGECVDCLGDEDCAKGSLCSAQRQCVPRVCESNVCTKGLSWFSCDGGKAYKPGQACGDDNPCTTNACDLATGCSVTNNDTACDDGDKCTSGDKCAGGKCAAASVNCDDNDACTDDSCDKAAGCKNTHNNAACDDGDKCTVNDGCSSGKCKGAKKDCDDGNACTGPDVCKDGSCDTPKVDCDDNNPCTDDGCSPAGAKPGCKNVENTAPCSDNNACTDKDACKDGKCVGLDKSCDDANACTADTCTKDGGCKHEALQDGKACDADGDQCTVDDVCAKGACAAGKKKTCDSGDPCFSGACDKTSGKCVFTFKKDQPCDDNNACTTGDACANDVCKAGKLVDCGDNNVCTEDKCDPKSTKNNPCENPPKAGPCDDGDVCTTGEACDGGKCGGGKGQCACQQNSDCAKSGSNPCLGSYKCDKSAAPYTCKLDPATAVKCDGNSDTVCSANTCDPSTGKCAQKPQNTGKACDDGDKCTEKTACAAGKCAGGSKVACDDSNPCTTDACDKAKGCTTTPLSEGAKCGDKMVCLAAKCVPGCNDNSHCGSGQVCKVGKCVSACQLDKLHPVNLVKEFKPPAGWTNQYPVATYSTKHKEFWLGQRANTTVHRYDSSWKATGKSFQRGALNSIAEAFAAAPDGDLIASGNARDVARFAEFSTTAKWKVFVGSNHSAPAVAYADNKVYVTNWNKPFSSMSLFVLDAANGKQLSSKGMPAPIATMIVTSTFTYGSRHNSGQYLTLQTGGYSQVDLDVVAPIAIHTSTFDGKEVCGLSQGAPGRIWCSSALGSCGAKDYQPLFDSSNWLTSSEMAQINTWAGKPGQKWKLCMSRATSSAATEVWDKCAGKKPVVTLAVNPQVGDSMGVYSETEFKKPPAGTVEQIKDPTVFAFSLKNKGKATVHPNTVSVYRHQSYPISYGKNYIRWTSSWATYVYGPLESDFKCPPEWGSYCGKKLWSSSSAAPIVEVYYATGCTTDKGCDDANACTADTCENTGKCAHKSIPGACDDGDACTEASACDGGVCKATKLKSCDDNDPCTKDACDPKTGKCSNTPLLDGDACGSGLVCSAGKCIKGCAKNADCGAGQECNKGLCIKACSPVVKPTFHSIRTFKLPVSSQGLVVGCGMPARKEFWFVDSAHNKLDKWQRIDSETLQSKGTFAGPHTVWGCAEDSADPQDWYATPAQNKGDPNSTGQVAKLSGMNNVYKWVYKNPLTNRPIRSVFEKDGVVYADEYEYSGHRIVKLDAKTGNYIGQFKTNGDMPGHLTALIGGYAYAAMRNNAGGFYVRTYQLPSFGALGTTAGPPGARVNSHQALFDGRRVCKFTDTALSRLSCVDLYGGCYGDKPKSDFDSELMSLDEQAQLSKWLGTTGKTWAKCAAGNPAIKDFLASCANKETVAVWHGASGSSDWFFGYYTSVPWALSSGTTQAIKDDKAFFFSHTHGKKIPVSAGATAKVHYPNDKSVGFGSSAMTCKAYMASCSKASSLNGFDCPAPYTTASACDAYLGTPTGSGTMPLKRVEIFAPK